eukprot:TRINITY_DN10303_c0_g1_i1.p1 TRINITY_DN10303_c0_g1~~TRINITY_DN10303_c0_g1_i1.p1  ORF type:complete len:241 (-),score=81.12 TRINITY_DN10303_c0_g1_i1:14-736(-)
MTSNFTFQQLKTTKLAEMHRNHILPSFDDRKEEERAIEIMTGETTRLFHEAQVSIKKLSTVEISPSEEKLRKNAQVALATSLQDLSLRFKRDQSNYLQELRRRNGGFPGKEKGIKISPGDEEEMETFEYNKGFTDQQLSTVDREVTMTAQRQKEIKQLHQSIVELSEVMKEMAILVIDQGTIIDRIDYNIEQSTTHVEQAIEELKQGYETQTSTKSKICILILCVLIIAVVFIIIFKKVI